MHRHILIPALSLGQTLKSGQSRFLMYSQLTTNPEISITFAFNVPLQAPQPPKSFASHDRCVFGWFPRNITINTRSDALVPGHHSFSVEVSYCECFRG